MHSVLEIVPPEQVAAELKREYICINVVFFCHTFCWLLLQILEVIHTKQIHTRKLTILEVHWHGFALSLKPISTQLELLLEGLKN